MIYLDTAATSLYKPETVQYAVMDALSSMASPGRGAHSAAMRAAECCYQCREALARLFHVPEIENVVFTFNATHALNIAIHTLVNPGCRVLISGYEHNAVTRPLHAAGAKVTQIDTPLFDPDAFLDRADALLRDAQLAICTHVSNVFGFILPIEQFASMCAERNVPLIVDASQSAGVLELDFSALGAEFVAMPGHKGLMGPQGTGVLLCKNDAKPLLYGGSGSAGAQQTMPSYLPDRLEAGTHNVVGIAGLLASVKHILDTGCGAIRLRERQLMDRFFSLLGADGAGLCLFYSPDPDLQSAVLSVQPDGMSCEAFAEQLEARGVAVRSGLQCAPAAHKTVGTLERGTVRFSFSPYNTLRQMEQTAEICKEIMNFS